jgi:hypothetical protein
MLRRFFVILSLVVSFGSAGAVAQRATTDSSLLTVDRIFASPEFRGATLLTRFVEENLPATTGARAAMP